MTHLYAPMLPVQLQMDRQQTGPKKWKTVIIDSINKNEDKTVRRERERNFELRHFSIKPYTTGTTQPPRQVYPMPQPNDPIRDITRMPLTQT